METTQMDKWNVMYLHNEVSFNNKNKWMVKKIWVKKINRWSTDTCCKMDETLRALY